MMNTRPDPMLARRGGGRLLLRLLIAVVAVMIPVGCVQDAVLIRTNIIEGKVVPTGVENPPPTTSPGSVIITVNTTIPTVGIRMNVVGSGTNVSLIQPIGPLPGSSEFSFASVTGEFSMMTERHKDVKVVARGTEFDLAWGSVFFEGFNETLTISNMDSVPLALNSPVRNNGVNNLQKKESGRAVFILFAEDFTIGGVPVTSARVLINDFDNPAMGTNMPDDGSLVPQTDRSGSDIVSMDLAAGDGVFTRVVTGLKSGTIKYGFVINNDDLIRRDPYEESTATSRSVLKIL